MRIVHVVCSDRFAGVEQFVLRLAISQQAAGHDVAVIGGAAERMLPVLVSAGASWAPATNLRSAISALRAHRRDADIVNTHMTNADVAAVVALPRRRTLVSTRHFALPRGRVLGVPIDLFVRRRIDAEIAISSAVAAATGIPSRVVHSGVPTPPTHQQPRERRLLMVQRLEPEKNTDLGIRAFVKSGLAAHGWRLDVAGDGSLRAPLQRLIDELGAAESVQLLGFCDDVAQLLQRASMLFAPCAVEGLGLALIEAMAAGVAPVAAAAAGHLDVLGGLDPRCGFVAGDATDAADALRALALDDDRRERLAEQARHRAHTEFSLEQQVIGTDLAYRAAMAGRRSRREAA